LLAVGPSDVESDVRVVGDLARGSLVLVEAYLVRIRVRVRVRGRVTVRVRVRVRVSW